MALLNRQGELIEATTIETDGITITALDAWQPQSGDGLLLEGSDEPEARFMTAPVIAINFAAFTDGRGLSLAVLLRTRYGYTGELRAVGDVHPDTVYYQKRCGFDTFQMPEGRSLPPANDTSTLAPYSDYYQASVLNPEPAFRRVRRGA